MAKGEELTSKTSRLHSSKAGQSKGWVDQDDPYASSFAQGSESLFNFFRRLPARASFRARGGMISATPLAIFLVPVFFVVVRRFAPTSVAPAGPAIPAHTQAEESPAV